MSSITGLDKLPMFQDDGYDGDRLHADGQQTVGVVDPATLTMAITSAVIQLGSFFAKVFGKKHQFSTGVRWLTAYYQYYVLGDASATSSNRVNEQLAPEAQAWFSVVLGVPIYDRYRLHALMGTNPADGAPLNKTDEQKINDYLNPQWTDTQGQSREAVARAVQIAKQFKWGAMPGSWAKYGVPANPPEPESETGGSGDAGGFLNLPGGKPNYLLWGGIAVAALALYLIYDSDS